jgi:hypothetical protein
VCVRMSVCVCVCVCHIPVLDLGRGMLVAQQHPIHELCPLLKNNYNKL